MVLAHVRTEMRRSLRWRFAGKRRGSRRGNCTRTRMEHSRVARDEDCYGTAHGPRPSSRAHSWSTADHEAINKVVGDDDTKLIQVYG